MCHGFVQQALIRTASHDGLAAAPPRHQCLIGHHVQIGRRLVRVVAIAAMLTQDRGDMVLERDQFFGLVRGRLLLCDGRQGTANQKRNDGQATDHDKLQRIAMAL